jgi:vitamin B12 transporter
MSIRFVTLHLLRSGLAAGALLSAPGLANAQATLLPELIVISPSLLPIEAEKVGSSVTVRSGEEIRSSGFNQLSDVMRTFPGVHVSQSGARGSLTQLRVRGQEANHLLVVVDGVAVNAVGDGEYNFADIPVDDIERVELLRGPQSGLYGANAQSGVLTIETRSGRGLTPQANARIEGGSQNSADGAASARGQVGPLYGAITVTHGATEGFNIARTGTPVGAETDGARRTAITAKGGIEFTPDFNVEGLFRHSKRTAEFDPQSFITGLVFDRASDLTRFEDHIGRVQANLSLFNGRWLHSAKYTTARQNLASFETGPQASASAGQSDTFFYKSSVLAGTEIAGGENHRLTGFVENRNERFSFESIFITGPDLAAARNGRTRTTTGVGGEYVLDLIRTGTTLSAALREDFNEPFQDEFTWRFTVSQQVAPIGGRLHASVGRGVTNPSFIEQFGFLTSTFVPNPNLVPESSVGWDVGWEQTFWGGRAVIDVTYFNSRLQNEIVTVFLPTFQSSVRNLDGTSTREGVETVVKLRPVDWLILSGTHTYTDARDDKGIQEIRRPRHAAAGSATVLFAEGRGKATVNVVYNGKMPDTWFKFPTETVTLAAYTLVGGQISYDTTPWSTVYLRAENVFDRRYEEVFSYRSPGACVYAGLKVRTN